MGISDNPSPDEVIRLLEAGNERFRSGAAAHPHSDAARLRLAAAENQDDHAFATIISCSDSRVPVELIFDAGIMDLFVIRVAGNVCNSNQIGSIEFGLTQVRTPVLVVLGHTQCGAVAAATRAVDGSGGQLERNIQPLVDAIVPAVERAAARHPRARGDDLIQCAIEENVWLAIENLFTSSPVVCNMVKEGEARVVGAIYDLAGGEVGWLPLDKVEDILRRVEASPGRQTELHAD